MPIRLARNGTMDSETKGLMEKSAYKKREEARAATEKQLVESIRRELPKLQELLAEVNGEYRYEDFIYRYYHQSFKVYGIQAETQKIVNALQALLPNVPLNHRFMEIYVEGTGKAFSDKDNYSWGNVTRPLLEAFFHARFFLEMACKYGQILAEELSFLPSGWAAFLYLYDIR